MSDFIRSSRHLALSALVVFGGLGSAFDPAAAAGERRPVAATVIYPGDIIREQMLTDADFPNAIAGSIYILSHEMLIGKVAKRTFLPGSPFPSNAVGVPRLVSVGSMVRLVFEEDGLEISTYASALQNGAAGDVISVRNMESGVTITGVIRADGSIRVGPG